MTPQQAVSLKAVAGSRTAPAREVARAQVLLGYAGGTSITELQRQLGPLSASTQQKCYSR